MVRVGLMERARTALDVEVPILVELLVFVRWVEVGGTTMEEAKAGGSNTSRCIVSGVSRSRTSSLVGG